MLSVVLHRKLGFLAAATIAVLGSAPLFAAEVTLTAPKAGSDLLSGLRATSVTLTTAQSKDAETQDLLSSARADYALIIGLLYSEGYYGGIVNILADGREVADIPPLDQPKSVEKILITVDPGPLFLFSRARVAPLASGTVLPDGFWPQEPARSRIIQNAVDAGAEAWRDLGHAKVEVKSQRIVADHTDNKLDADIALSPGPQLTFGKLILEGKSSVREARIRKIMGLPEGEVFSPDALKKAAARLRRTGVFRSVAIREADEIGPDNTLDITAITVDERPRRLGFGAELSSLDGLSLNAFWLRRNLLGGAERLRLDGGVAGIGGGTGGIDYNLSARLDRPATLSPDTNGYLLGEFRQDDEPSYLERSSTLEIGFEHIFSDQLSGSVGLSLTYSDVEDDLGKRNFHYIGLPTEITWDRRDDPLEPTRGFYVNLDALPFYGIGSTASGLHSELDLRGYRGFGNDDRFVLAGRLQFGSVVGAEIDSVPPGLLFFSGGGGTVRGQAFESLGVDLGGGDISGGRSFLGLSAELRAKITKTIGVVGFYDTGYISADSIPSSDSPSHSGAGVGLRYYTGIGAIRVDVAQAVNGGDGGGVQFYIGIGQAF